MWCAGASVGDEVQRLGLARRSFFVHPRQWNMALDFFPPFINDFAVETDFCLTLPANGTNTKRLIIWARFLQAYVHHARAISLKHASCLFFAVFDMLVGASENCAAVHSKTNFRLVAKMRTISLDWLGSSTCRTRTLAEHRADASLMLLVSRSHGMNLR